MRSKLRRVAESGRQWETVGDSGRRRKFMSRSVFRESTHGQETLGAQEVDGTRKLGNILTNH